jgi:hypothetical protein
MEKICCAVGCRDISSEKAGEVKRRLKTCDISKVHIDKYYYILNQSERVIAVYGGNKKSLTWQAIQQAIHLKHDIYIIYV